MSKIKEFLLKKYNLKNEDFVGEVSVSSIIDNLNEVRAESKRLLSEPLKEYKPFAAEVSLGAEEGSRENKHEESVGSVASEAIEHEASHLSDSRAKDVQRLYYILVAEIMSKMSYPIFAAHYFDFRGRMYPKSASSFMYLKALRPFFRTGEVSPDWDRISKSRYFKEVVNSAIDFGEKLSGKFKTDTDKYMAGVIFLELAKIKKSKLITENGVSLQKFIDFGVDMFLNQDEEDIEAEDYGYYLQMVESMNNFVNNNAWVNVTIIRDSTASSFQH